MTDSRTMLLVVDDDANSARALVDLLRSSGYDAEMANSAAEALQVIRRRSPGVVILDIRMPDMNGYALADKIRKSLPATQLRLIALTGADGAPEEYEARASGFDYFFTKPVDFNDLLCSVKNAISGLHG